MHKVLIGVSGFLTLAALVGVGHLLTHPTTRQPIAAGAHPSSARTKDIGPRASAARVSTVVKAPAFQVPSLNADVVRVSATRPTVVYFMSSSCGTCVSGEQHLAQIAAHTPASVQWLSLDVDPGYDSPRAVLAMAHLTGARWPQAFATEAIIQAYHVTQLDTVAVIAKNGTLLYDGALPSTSRLDTLIHAAIAAS